MTQNTNQAEALTLTEGETQAEPGYPRPDERRYHRLREIVGELHALEGEIGELLDDCAEEGTIKRATDLGEAECAITEMLDTGCHRYHSEQGRQRARQEPGEAKTEQGRGVHVEPGMRAWALYAGDHDVLCTVVECATHGCIVKPDDWKDVEDHELHAQGGVFLSPYSGIKILAAQHDGPRYDPAAEAPKHYPGLEVVGRFTYPRNPGFEPTYVYAEAGKSYVEQKAKAEHQASTGEQAPAAPSGTSTGTETLVNVLARIEAELAAAQSAIAPRPGATEQEKQEVERDVVRDLYSAATVLHQVRDLLTLSEREVQCDLLGIEKAAKRLSLIQ